MSKLRDLGLTREECIAFRAFFRGAIGNVKKFSDRDFVFMGKAECEWVPFDDFWIGKAVDIGLVTVEKSEPRLCKGAKDPNTTVIEYTIQPTDLGFELRNDY